MYFTLLIPIVLIWTFFSSKRPKILYKEYLVGNGNFCYDIFNKNPILDTEKEGVEHIICTYFYNGRIHKIIVDDFFDIRGINLNNRDKIERAYVQSQDESYDEMNEAIDVTDIIKEYAGPYQDFHDYKRDYRKMIPFKVKTNNKMFLTIKFYNDQYMIVDL
mgnify:FL=1